MTPAKIKLLSHASILLKAGGKKILTDPWFFGTAFNDGWELNPEPDLEKVREDIRDIDILWISHEHPDHLHFPSLKWVFQVATKQIKVFFQRNNSTKVFEALEKIGYKDFVSMTHLERIPVGDNIEMACYAHRHLDSSLAVFIDGKFWLLNVNDTELNYRDIQIIRRNFGSPTVVYNQFSIAGSEGIESRLTADSSAVMLKMKDHHLRLGARVSVPFASFVRFARSDNRYLNKFANSVSDVHQVLQAHKCNMIVQAVGGGELYWRDVGALPENAEEIHGEGVAFFSKLIVSEHDSHEYKRLEPLEVISAIEGRVSDWKGSTNKLLWSFLRLSPIYFCVSDWGNEVWELDFERVAFTKVGNSKKFDVLIASQPLHQAFKLPFGIQTLGVSGRYRVSESLAGQPPSWRKIRVISSLYNAEIYLKASTLFSGKTMRWVWQRRHGLLPQILQQLRRFQGV